MTPKVVKMKCCEICHVKSGRKGDIKRKFLSKFPLNEERCRQWVKATGNEDLVYLPIEKLHELKYVCDNHFKLEDFNKNRTKLNRNAVPTQNLWSEPISDEMLKDFPLHVAGDKSKQKSSKETHISYLEPVPPPQVKDHNYSPPHPVSILRPSTSTLTPNAVTIEKNNAKILKRKNCENEAHPPTTTTSAMVACNSTTTSNNFDISNISNSNLPKSSTSASTLTTTNSYDIQDSEDVFDDIPTQLESDIIIEGESAPRPAKIKKLRKKLRMNEEKKKNKLKDKKNEGVVVNTSTDDLIKNMSSPVTRSIIESAIMNSNRNAARRCFSEFNKTIALAISKNSPKTFKYLSHLLPFPSTRTLLRAVAPLNLNTCIDKNIINNLQVRAKSLSDVDKICVLVFNTMDLKKRLIYNVNTDKIDGYEDFGEDHRTGNIASSVLVTMVQGICKNFKQPIAHYFFNGEMPIERLAAVIERNIRAITESGYEVIATICDHRPTNMAALNLLKPWGNTSESNYFVIDDKKILIIYNVPHLLKSIRDHFYRAGEIIIANKRGKWEHLLLVEKLNHSMLHFQKITKSHVKPNIKRNMKVTCAIEIFSNTVAGVLKCLSMGVDYKENSMEILQTAEVVEFLDRLFDCTNGPCSKSDVKKNIRENVTKNSFHHKLWADYEIKLASMKFINSDDQYVFNDADCIMGYTTTLSSLQDMWSYLQYKNIEILNLRHLNMDAFEELFKKVSQYCPPFNSPTCNQFIAGLKASLITHLSAPLEHINSQEEGYRALCAFQQNIFPKDDHVENCKNVAEEMLDIQKIFKNMDIPPTMYLGSYLALALSKCETCQTCINSIKVASPELNTMYDCNPLNEWWKNKNYLTYPTEALCRAIDEATEAFETFVQPQIYFKDVANFCKTEILKRPIDFSWLCEQHRDKMSEEIIRLLSLLFIRNYCQIANNFLIATTSLQKKTRQEKEKEISNLRQPFSDFTIHLAQDGHEIS